MPDLEMLQASSRPVRSLYAPGPAFFGVAVAIGVAFLAADSAVHLAYMSSSFLAGLVLGMVWFVLFATTAYTTRLRLSPGHWLRWLGIPAIGILCLALAIESIPLRTRFELGRTAFQQVALHFEARSDAGATNVGLFQIDGIVPLSNGVFLQIDSASFVNRCGFAYAPDGRPDLDQLDVDLGGGWWFGCERF